MIIAAGQSHAYVTWFFTHSSRRIPLRSPLNPRWNVRIQTWLKHSALRFTLQRDFDHRRNRCQPKSRARHVIFRIKISSYPSREIPLRFPLNSYLLNILTHLFYLSSIVFREHQFYSATMFAQLEHCHNRSQPNFHQSSKYALNRGSLEKSVAFEYAYPACETLKKRVVPSCEQRKNRPSPRSLTGARAKGDSAKLQRGDRPVFIHTRNADRRSTVCSPWDPRMTVSLEFSAEEFRSLLDTVQECCSFSRVWHNGEILATVRLCSYSFFFFLLSSNRFLFPTLNTVVCPWYRCIFGKRESKHAWMIIVAASEDITSKG